MYRVHVLIVMRCLSWMCCAGPSTRPASCPAPSSGATASSWASGERRRLLCLAPRAWACHPNCERRITASLSLPCAHAGRRGTTWPCTSSTSATRSATAAGERVTCLWLLTPRPRHFNLTPRPPIPLLPTNNVQVGDGRPAQVRGAVVRRGRPPPGLLGQVAGGGRDDDQPHRRHDRADGGIGQHHLHGQPELQQVRWRCSSTRATSTRPARPHASH